MGGAPGDESDGPGGESDGAHADNGARGENRGGASGPTAAVAAFAVGLAARDIPDAAAEIARACILDTLACALAGLGERVARAARAMVIAETDGATRSGPGDGRAAVWGTPVRCAPARAAFANGVAAHALDFDDVSWAMEGHPSAPLLPAVLAVAEARGASAADALIAYVVGFEVQARIGQAMTRAHYARGWHPTATMGALGATAAAGRLLGLDAPAMRRALGIACSQLAGTRMNFGTDTKPLHAGFAAQAGVVSAQLAAAGVTARSDGLECELGLADLYEGRTPLAMPALPAFGASGSRTARGAFALQDPGVELKPYPSCRFTHRAIDAVLAVRAALANESGDALVSLDCEESAFAREIVRYEQARSGLEGKFCMPYCLAVAWLDGAPVLASFADARVVRDDVRALTGRVRVRYTDTDAATVTATLASGRRASERVVHPLGSPARPMSRDHRVAKVRALVADRADALIAAVASLATATAPAGLAPLVRALRPAAP